MPTCYLVLGNPRSGTSCAAGILHNLGVPMGEKINDPVNPRWDFIGADEWNPKGLFEDAAFGNLFVEVLGWPWPNRDVKLSDLQLTNLKSLIATRCKANEDWGVKSGGLAYFLPELINLCPIQIKTIYCRRNISRSIKSWAARDNCSEEQASKIILALQVRLNKYKYDLELDFDDLLRWPTVLAKFTGKLLTNQVISFPDKSLIRF